MKGKVTIQSAIDELQRMFKLLNDTYFSGELARPVITIQTDTTSGAYGWISSGKVWNSKDNQWFREINICAEYLNRDPEFVICTLMHEMCHLYSLQKGIQDTSNNGVYHNKVFRDTASMRGLIVEKDARYGFCITKPSEEFTQLVRDNCRSGCFKLERAKTYRNGTPKVTVSGGDGKEKTVTRTKQSYRKYTCPMCGLTIRATRNIDGKLLCIDCDAELTADF